jgi:outer membrane protein OmpA-like peptidoglycan-associated protein
VLPTLKQRTVVLVGIGNTVEPQTALDTRTHNNLVAIWRAIAKHAGAACVAVYDQTGGNHPRANDLPAVSTVTIPPVPPPPPPCGQTVLYNSGAVGFRKNIADFIDPAAAHEAIGKIADVMRQGRQRAKLIGTTATDNTVEFRHRLGKQRAEAVKRELVGFGISADRIETVGVGTDWPGHIPDIGPDGHLLPGPAQKNRSVVVELSCS